MAAANHYFSALLVYGCAYIFLLAVQTLFSATGLVAYLYLLLLGAGAIYVGYISGPLLADGILSYASSVKLYCSNEELYASIKVLSFDNQIKIASVSSKNDTIITCKKFNVNNTRSIELVKENEKSIAFIVIYDPNRYSDFINKLKLFAVKVTEV
ncbi:hypothetical protein [Mucisphaera sp.]|uniref:hypothetical protein n=1 Tax=Mucisphaera sp. TaxID=2913024 RepID=UPI003D11F27D